MGIFKLILFCLPVYFMIWFRCLFMSFRTLKKGPGRTHQAVWRQSSLDPKYCARRTDTHTDDWSGGCRWGCCTFFAKCKCKIDWIWIKVIFLDAHCEPNKNWLPPLLAPIRHNKRVMTVPVIDGIDMNTFVLFSFLNSS